MYKFRFVKIKEQKKEPQTVPVKADSQQQEAAGGVREKRLLKCRRLRQTADEMSFLDNIQLSHSSM